MSLQYLAAGKPLLTLVTFKRLYLEMYCTDVVLEVSSGAEWAATVRAKQVFRIRFVVPFSYSFRG